jgi:hypothetical protein
MGTALIAFVAGIVIGGYMTQSEVGPSFGGFSIHSIIFTIQSTSSQPHFSIMPTLHTFIPTLSLPTSTFHFTHFSIITFVPTSSPTLPPATAVTTFGQTQAQPPFNTPQGCDPSDPTCGGSQTCDPSDPSCSGIAASPTTVMMNQTVLLTQPLNQTFVVTSFMPTTRVVTQPAPQPQLEGFSMIALVATIVIIAAAAGLLLMRRRAKPSSGPESPATPTGPKAGIIYCQKCGTQNPGTNKFCGSCATEL